MLLHSGYFHYVQKLNFTENDRTRENQLSFNTSVSEKVLMWKSTNAGPKCKRYEVLDAAKDHSFCTYSKVSKKTNILTPRYAYVRPLILRKNLRPHSYEVSFTSDKNKKITWIFVNDITSITHKKEIEKLS